MRQVMIIEADEFNALKEEVTLLKRAILDLVESANHQCKAADDTLLTLESASRKYKISPKTLRLAIKEGHIKGSRAHDKGRVRFLSSEVENYFRSSKYPKTTGRNAKSNILTLTP